VIAAVLLGGMLVLSGCSGQQAGSAALIGDSRITEQQLTTTVQEVLSAQGQPVDTAAAPLTSQTLGRMIVIDLVDRLALSNDVVVTQGRIDEQLATYITQAGDKAAMEQTFVQQGVAPSQIEPVIRLNIQAQDLGIKLAPQGTAEEQGKAVFDAVTALSDELDVTTSPRFGTWDAKTLQVGPTPADLATTPADLTTTPALIP
jgi:hypothetical protein